MEEKFILKKEVVPQDFRHFRTPSLLASGGSHRKRTPFPSLLFRKNILFCYGISVRHFCVSKRGEVMNSAAWSERIRFSVFREGRWTLHPFLTAESLHLPILSLDSI